MRKDVDIAQYAFKGSYKHSFVSHDFEVQYTIYNENHQDKIQMDLYDGATLLDVVDSYIYDFISDAFQDVIDEALSQGGAKMSPSGIYEIYEVGSNIYLPAELYIEKKANELNLLIVDDYTNVNEPLYVSKRI